MVKLEVTGNHGVRMVPGAPTRRAVDRDRTEPVKRKPVGEGEWTLERKNE